MTAPAPRPSTAIAIAAACGLLAACAEGGSEDRVESEVRITADHHLYGLKGEQAFPQFPVRSSDLQVETGTLAFDDQSAWKLNGQAGSRYDLAKNGALVFRVPNGRNPDLAFPGAYGLRNDSGLFFFCDQVRPKVGLFFGARLVRGAAEVVGDWHAFGLQILTPPQNAVVDPDNVGRAFAGTITVAADGSISAGSAEESTGEDLDVTGSLRAFDDGSVEVGLRLDARTEVTQLAFTAAASVTTSQPVVTSTLLGLETADNERAGLLALMRKRDGRVAVQDLAGEYWIGFLTVFANPTNAGTEAAYGTLTLTDTAGWRIEAQDSRTKFRLSGGFTIDADGTLTLTVNGSSETWRGAFSQDLDTVVFADHDLRGSVATRPELNMFVALRKAEVK